VWDFKNFIVLLIGRVSDGGNVEFAVTSIEYIPNLSNPSNLSIYLSVYLSI
jgi:hypothetical protein